MIDRTNQTPQWFLRHEMGSVTDISGPYSEKWIHQLVRESNGEYQFYWVSNDQLNLSNPGRMYWFMLSEVAELVPERMLPEIDWPITPLRWLHTARMNIPQ